MVLPKVVRSRAGFATLLGVAAVFALAPLAQSNHPNNWLQPGDDATIGGNGCTLDFVFDGPGGQVYIGIAAHCGNAGQAVSSNGYNNFGTIVYDNDDPDVDFALIQVNAAQTAHVKAEVRLWPGFPVGVISAAETNVGDLIDLSGFGIGFGLSPTLQKRQGVLLFDDSQEYCSVAPAIFGDSGGPVLHHASKKALGIVNSIDPIGCQTTLQGTMLTSAIANAGADGFPITLRTV